MISPFSDSFSTCINTIVELEYLKSSDRFTKTFRVELFNSYDSGICSGFPESILDPSSVHADVVLNLSTSLTDPMTSMIIHISGSLHHLKDGSIIIQVYRFNPFVSSLYNSKLT